MHRMTDARAMPEPVGSSALALVGLKTTPHPSLSFVGPVSRVTTRRCLQQAATPSSSRTRRYNPLHLTPPFCALAFLRQAKRIIVFKADGSLRKFLPTKSEKRWYAQLEIRQTAFEFELGVCEGNPHHATNVITAFSVAGSAEGVSTLNGRCATSQCSRGGLAAAPL